ncbi:MAG TPA: TonB-dependent receptor [Steroidobacteraceae bacterium]|nr:TonB-dependent receptor [Steroidobacteraceae bacterium]
MSLVSALLSRVSSHDRTWHGRVSSTVLLVAGVGLSTLQVGVTHAADDDSSTELGKVVVTSRNREEIAQDVPLPISVVSGNTLDRDNIVTMSDLTQKVPNLLVNSPNSRQTSIAIRGLGKNSANDSMEASVGVIVDNVFATHVGMSWTNYIDVDRIEVARGPQGTLLGKNTTLGVVNIVTKKPTFTPQASLEADIGSSNSYTFKGSSSNALIDGLLAYRASVYADRNNGDLKNIYQSSESWLQKNRLGGRLQFLLTPSDSVNARIIVDYGQSDERINIQPYIVDPTTLSDGSARATTYSTRLARSYFDGYQPLIGSWDSIDTNDARPLLTTQKGISAEINWTISDFTLTSISAFRSLDFDAKNDGDQTHFAIARNGTLLHTKSWSQEFRFTSPTGKFVDYQVGLYAMKVNSSSTGRNLYGEDAGAFYATNAQYTTLNATPSGRLLLRDTFKSVFFTTETRPVTKSIAAFGQLNWHFTDKLTLTTGLRETYEDKDNDINKVLAVPGATLNATNYPTATAGELSAAAAVRSGQVGTVYGFKQGIPRHDKSLSWLFSPSYKVSDDVLLYASAGYGAKSGAVQFNNSTGAPQNVDPEKATDFELGIKSLLLKPALMLNVNLFNTSVNGYQTNLRIVDPASSTGFSTILGNIESVRLRGVEIEGLYTINRGLSINFGGSYNQSIYTSFHNAVCPPESPASSVVCDVTGSQLPNAPKVILNVGIDYRLPLVQGASLHAYVNETYRSKINLNESLSQYGWQDAYTLTSGGIGIAGPRDRWEIDLVTRNAFDTRYATAIGSFSNNAGVGYTFGDRRYIGLVFRSKL